MELGAWSLELVNLLLWPYLLVYFVLHRTASRIHHSSVRLARGRRASSVMVVMVATVQFDGRKSTSRGRYFCFAPTGGRSLLRQTYGVFYTTNRLAL